MKNLQKYSRLLSEFETMEGTNSNTFDEKDWSRFDRFVEARMEEEKENWIFERSSGYPGYRNTETNTWIYESEYLEKFGEKEFQTAEEETLQKIKAVLPNESQAIRLIEQYGEWIREIAQKEIKQKIDKVSLSNKDINSFGDGFEYAIKLLNKELKL